MSNKKIDAIDLIIEDLNIAHSEIRIKSKELGCETELNQYKNELISYLIELREKLS
jgi:hypothetical protein